MEEWKVDAVRSRPISNSIKGLQWFLGFANFYRRFQQVFRHYGLLEDIVSDRGPQLTSRVWRAFVEKLGVTVILKSRYSPRYNRQVERTNQELGRFLPWAEYTQNSRRRPFPVHLGISALVPWTLSQIKAPGWTSSSDKQMRFGNPAQVRFQCAVCHQKAQADRHRSICIYYESTLAAARAAATFPGVQEN